MADIPSWAVPAKGGATPPPVPPKPAPSGGIGGFVSNAISGVKNFFSGLSGSKPAPTPAAPSVPSWAVAATKAPDATASLPQAIKAPSKAPQVPSWAVPVGGEKKSSSAAPTPPPDPMGTLKDKPISTDTSTQAIPDATTDSSAETAKNIAQGFPRMAAQLAVSIGQSAKNVPYDLYSAAEKVGLSVKPDVLEAAKEEGASATSVTPTGPVTAVLGKDPIQGIASDVADTERAIRNSPFAQKTGLANHSLAIAFPAVIGNEAFNVLSNFVGGEGELVDQLVKAGTEEEAANILRKTGMDESVIQDFAPHLAAATDKGEVKDILDIASKAHDAVNAGPATEIKAAADSYVGEAEEAFKPEPEKPDIEVGSTGVATITVESATSQVIQKAIETAPTAVKVGDTIVNNSGYPLKIESIQPSKIAGKSDITIVSNNGMARTIKGVTMPEAVRPEVGAPAEKATSGKVSQQDILKEAAQYPSAENFGAVAGRKYNLSFKQAEKLWQEAKDKGVDISTPATKSIGDIAQQHAEKYFPAKPDARSLVDDRSSEAPRYDVDTPALAHGTYNVEDGDIKSGAFEGWTTEAKNLFQYDYVNVVRGGTRKIAGALARKQLVELGFSTEAGDGEKEILQFEGFERGEDGRIVALPNGADRTGMFKKVSDMYDDLFQGDRMAGVQARGKPIAHRDNYLPIYIRTPDGSVVDGEGNVISEAEAPKPSGRRVGKSAPFALPRVFKNNAEVLQAGLKLAFPNMPDMLAMRTVADYKAVGDAQLFNGAARMGMVIPEPALPKDALERAKWKAYDTERFPKYTMQYRDPQSGVLKQYTGVYYGPTSTVKRATLEVPNGFVDKVNNFLHNPDSGTTPERALARLAQISGTLKNVALSIGIPNLSKLGVNKILSPVLGKDLAERITSLGSGYSVHLYNLATSAGLFKQNVAQLFRYAADPIAAEKWLNENLDKLLTVSKNGGTISSEEHESTAFDLEDLNSIAGVGRQANAMSKYIHGVFGESLFGKVMPAMKAQGTLARTDQLIKTGMSATDAMRQAADEQNNIWGGMNLDALGRNKNFQNALRSVFLAPDFAERNVNIGVRTARSLTTGWNDKTLASYRSFAALFTLSYAAANMIQYSQTGTFMVSNDPLHIFSIKLPGQDAKGRTRYVNLYGTGVDALRIPGQIASSLIEGKYNDTVSVLNNRLALIPQSAMGLLTNTNWAGQRIYGNDIYGNPIPPKQEASNLFNSTIGNLFPSSVGGALSAASGSASPEQAIVQGLALPVGYVSEKPNQSTINQLKADATTAIQSGDYTLFNKLVRAKVISSRSRSTFIKDALTGTKTAAQLRTSAKDKARIQKEEQGLLDEGITKNTQ